MNRLRWLSFELWYLGRPPWESGIVPPEVEDFIAVHRPGRILDLGCGSGTSSLAFARAGWSVCGLDFSAHAIRMARRKAHFAGLAVDFQVGDVSRLPSSVFTAAWDLALDIGCFHGLNPRERRSYLAGLDRLLAPGGSWLVYGFFGPQESPLSGWTAGELPGIEERWRLVWRQDGLEKKSRRSAWFCINKVQDPRENLSE